MKKANNTKKRNEMKKIQAVVFDMDGLMFDTERIWYESVLKVNELYGTNIPESLVLECVGLRTDATNKLLQERMGDGFDIKLFRRWQTEIMTNRLNSEGLPIKAGLIKLLEFLKAKHIKMAIASSSSVEQIEACFRQASFKNEYFECIIDGGMVEKSKPHPEIYQIACQKLGVAPQNTLAVEDSEVGVLSAVAGGLNAVWIPDFKTISVDAQKLLFAQFKTLDEIISLFE